MRRQRVPVGDEEVAFVFVLQLHPILQDTMVMAEVQTASGAHAGKDALVLTGYGTQNCRLPGLATAVDRWVA